MQGETQTLRDIYWRFVERKMPIDEAARQITEYTRLYRVEPGSLDLEPMSQEERSKVEELLDYLLQPIREQFLLGKISMEEAAYRIRPYLVPFCIWALNFNITRVSAEEQKKLEELMDHIITALREPEPNEAS